MSQISLEDADKREEERTRRKATHAEMESMVPWKALVEVNRTPYPVTCRGPGPIRCQPCRA